MLISSTPLIVPYLKDIVNSCIQSSYFPSQWKIAKIIPLPKNTQPTEFNELRPISILPTMSKICERILYNQIYAFVESENILPSIQSGFRRGHSCTTALLNVIDDIKCLQDNSMDTVLVALDFSKAFDSLNLIILETVLKYWGFSGPAIKLIASYLKERQQFVDIKG